MLEQETVQRERIERIAKTIEPDCVVDFIIDGDAQIRFRVFKTSGKMLIARSGDWEPSRLAGLSDQAVTDLLQLLFIGEMGRSNDC